MSAPYLLTDLTQYVIPKGWNDSRFGVISVSNPEGLT